MQYLDDFKQALEKKQSKNKIAYTANTTDFVNTEKIESVVGKNAPEGVKYLFTLFNGLSISEPRHFDLLKFANVEIFEDRFLSFALINETEKICFDMKELNVAGEWDVINYSNGFVITKTLASFLTNKVWAWIERARTIWKEELYD
jgi:hypothetical protein